MNSQMNEAKAEMLIRKPAAEVYEAFVNPAVTSKFWFTDSTGKLEEGASVVWTWKMYNLDVPVKVLELVKDESILIEWGEGANISKAKWNFKKIDSDKTFLSITHFDFSSEGDELMKGVIDSTGGFALVVAGLKAWLEHGLDLNLVADRYPADLLKA